MPLTTISKAVFLLSALATARAGQTTFTKCDISQDGNTNVAEVQLMVNQGLGVTPANNDLNSDGIVNVVDIQIVMNAAAGLGCVAAPQAQIGSLSETTADPFDQLTITGTGFDPANAAISVLLIPESGGPPIAVPAYAATSTMVQIAVPPFFNTGTGAFTAGTVDVQVLQLDGSTLATSNVMTGLEINAPPAISAGVPLGAITSAFLTANLNVSSTIQSEAATNSSLGNLAADLAQYNTDLNSLVSAIVTVSNDPSQSVTVPTADGLTFSLNAQVLALSDQLCLAFVEQFVAQMGTLLNTELDAGLRGTSSEASQMAMLPGPTPVPKLTFAPCTFNTGDPRYDADFCSSQTYGQQQYKQGVKGLQIGVAIEGSYYLLLTGGLAAAGSAGAGGISTEGFAAYQVSAAAATPSIAAFATAPTPPSMYDSLSKTVKQVFNSLLLSGKAILQSALDAVNVYQDSSAVSPSSAGQTPQGGVVLCGTQSNEPNCVAPQTAVPGGRQRSRASEASCATVVNAYQIEAGGILTTELLAPLSQQVTNVSAITIPAPTGCTSAQSDAWNNYCLATFNTTSNACTVGDLIQQNQCINAALGVYLNCFEGCTTTNSNLPSVPISPLALSPADRYTLAVATLGSGRGRISPPSPPGTPCGANCWTYAAGTSVKLTAKPDPGSMFTSWSGGDCPENGPCVVTMSSNRSLTAAMDLAPGYSYGGVLKTKVVSGVILPSSCARSPELTPQESDATAQLVVSAPLQSRSSFSGSLTLSPRTVTTTNPTLTCANPDGTTTITPGISRVSLGAGSTLTISGTSDGHSISVSEATRSLFCAGTTTCSVSGAVSILASKAVVTLKVTSSIASAAGAVTSETTLILTEAEQ